MSKGARFTQLIVPLEQLTLSVVPLCRRVAPAMKRDAVREKDVLLLRMPKGWRIFKVGPLAFRDLADIDFQPRAPDWTQLEDAEATWVLTSGSDKWRATCQRLLSVPPSPVTNDLRRAVRP